MSIEIDSRSSCPYCSTKLQYYYINLTEKMLICTKKKCLFPFDTDDISPYIIKVDSDNVDGSSSSSSLLDDKFLNLIQSTSNLKQTQSKYKSPNSSSTESLSNLSQTKPNRLTKTNGQTKLSGQTMSNGKTKSNGQTKSSGQTMSNEETMSNGQTKSNGISNSESLSSKIASNLPEMSTSNLKDTITLKTLGITLKVDAKNKNKNSLQSNSSQCNELSIDLTANNPSTSASNNAENDLSQLFNMNDFPISTVEEESSINATTGNGLLNASANAMGNENALTVEEYSKMLFGQSDIDINLDDLLSNSNTMGVNTQGNDAIDMDIDELLGTFNSLESSTLNKTSGNDMNLDFDSFMANLDASFAEAGIPNGISGNNLNVDLNSILENTNGNNSLDMINSNNNIYAEMVNENNNGTDDNHNALDLTLGSIDGQNGYSHENVENGVKDLVEDEGKDVVGKITNGALKEGKKAANKNDYEITS